MARVDYLKWFMIPACVVHIIIVCLCISLLASTYNSKEILEMDLGRLPYFNDNWNLNAFTSITVRSGQCL